MRKISVCFIISVLVVTFVGTVPALANERVVTKVSRDPLGAYYYLIVEKGEAFLRTSIQEHVDEITFAKSALAIEFLYLSRDPGRWIETLDGYQVHFCTFLIGTEFFVKNGYVVLNLGNAWIDGKKIYILN